MDYALTKLKFVDFEEIVGIRQTYGTDRQTDGVKHLITTI